MDTSHAKTSFEAWCKARDRAEVGLIPPGQSLKVIFNVRDNLRDLGFSLVERKQVVAKEAEVFHLQVAAQNACKQILPLANGVNTTELRRFIAGDFGATVAERCAIAASLDAIAFKTPAIPQTEFAAISGLSKSAVSKLAAKGVPMTLAEAQQRKLAGKTARRSIHADVRVETDREVKRKFNK